MLAEPTPTSEERAKLRADEEKKMAETAHLLLIHAKGERGPLLSTAEDQRKTACLYAYASLRQCLPKELRNAEDEAFFANKLQENVTLRLVNKVVEPNGATTVLRALQAGEDKPTANPNHDPP
jgi:hypothetical protein